MHEGAGKNRPPINHEGPNLRLGSPDAKTVEEAIEKARNMWNVAGRDELVWIEDNFAEAKEMLAIGEKEGTRVFLPGNKVGKYGVAGEQENFTRIEFILKKVGQNQRMIGWFGAASAEETWRRGKDFVAYLP